MDSCLKELLASSFHWQRPTAIRYPNITTEEGTEPLQNRALGKGEILAEGSDLLIIALGHQYLDALIVARAASSTRNFDNGCRSYFRQTPRH